MSTKEGKSEEMNGCAEDSKELQSTADELTAKFLELRRQALQQGLSERTIARTFRGTDSKTVADHFYATYEAVADFVCNLSWKRIKAQPVIAVNILVAFLAICFALHTLQPLRMASDYIYYSPCLIDSNPIVSQMARPVAKCSMCAGMKEAPIERNMTTELFLKKYAYTGTPVLIKDATTNWTAMHLYNFTYFKNLYTTTKDALRSVEEDCQFFPYNTEFFSLREVFRMSEARATFQPGEQPWYIGWSNCHPEIAAILRETYQRPFFLPNDSESSVLDWMFMGGTGEGANLHLDFVLRPSWQAQISGIKTWHLVPPPECEHVCHSFDIKVEKGDIIVIDTNIWYHGTYVHPGEISITIGSEYD